MRFLGKVLVLASLAFIMFLPNLARAVPTAPTLSGWGGLGLKEVNLNGLTGQNSNVFPGQTMSQFEEGVQAIATRQMNLVRSHMDATCSHNGRNYGTYNSTAFGKAIKIAQHYGMWIILDYHGYDDPFVPTDESCWINLWSGITNQFANNYTQIIWEPINEPNQYATGTACLGDTACTAYLSTIYNSWITQTRNQGDTHWTIVQNICSYSCGYCPSGSSDCSNAVNGFPTVMDSQNRILISIHSYFNYNYYHASYSNTTAENVANAYYQTLIAGVSRTGWPPFSSEGGTDPLCGMNSFYATQEGTGTCLSNTGTNQTDWKHGGSAGYTTTNFHFIQTLTNLYDTNPSGQIGYAWWTAGSWTDTDNLAAYGHPGAIWCAGQNPPYWGCILRTAITGTVGGQILPVDKIGVIAPYLIITLIVGGLIGFGMLRKSRSVHKS